MHHLTLKILIILSYMFFANDAYAGNRILWIESYHEGYEWTDSLNNAINEALRDQEVTLKIFHLDSKRNQAASFITKAVQQSISLIQDFKPNVVIASDDIASKYVVMPYFKNSPIPFIFCGINNSAEQYGYPYKNTTGILEQDPISKLIFSLSRFRSVYKVGYLSDDSDTSRILAKFYKTQSRFILTDHFVDSFEKWRETFRNVQKDIDVLIIGNTSSIANWDENEARNFVLKETKIPTGCLLDFLSPCALLGCIKVPEEQGRWAAETALKVLKGTPVSDIPIATPNDYRFIVNKKIAKVLKIKLPKSYTQRADVILE